MADGSLAAAEEVELGSSGGFSMNPEEESVAGSVLLTLPSPRACCWRQQKETVTCVQARLPGILVTLGPPKLGGRLSHHLVAVTNLELFKSFSLCF